MRRYTQPGLLHKSLGQIKNRHCGDEREGPGPGLSHTIAHYHARTYTHRLQPGGLQLPKKNRKQLNSFENIEIYPQMKHPNTTCCSWIAETSKLALRKVTELAKGNLHAKAIVKQLKM